MAFSGVVLAAALTVLGGCMVHPDESGHVDIPSGAPRLPDGAFSSCILLVSINIGTSSAPWSIGGSAFAACTNLTAVTFTPGETNLVAVGDYAFRGCSSLQTLALPASTQTIGDGSFSSCPSLPAIFIPGNVTAIGSSAFQDAAGVQSITFSVPSKLTALKDYAFGYLAALKSLELPTTVLTLGEAAFSGAFMLTSVWIPNGTQIEIDTFDGCGCDGALFKPGAILCDCKAAARWPCDDAPPPSL